MSVATPPVVLLLCGVTTMLTSSNPDGAILQSAPKDEEYLLSFVLKKGPSNFGRDGRIKHSKELLKIIPAGQSD